MAKQEKLANGGSYKDATSTVAERSLAEVEAVIAQRANPHITPDALDPGAAYSTRVCSVYMIDATTAEVTFRLDGQELKRIRSRCASRNLADYFWDMILKKAIMSHVY